MKDNIICIDLTKFNNEKLVEVGNLYNLDTDVLLKNKKNGFAKLYIDITDTNRVVAYTTKKNKNIEFTDVLSDIFSKIESVEIKKELVNFDLDSILEKISKYGLDSLASLEKEFLDNLSKD